MNKRTDKEELLEAVIAGETEAGIRAASLENVLRLARQRRRGRTIRRVGLVAAILLVAAVGVVRYFVPKSAEYEIAQAQLSLTNFMWIVSQPLSSDQVVTSRPLPVAQIVTPLPLPNLVQTVARNYHEVGDDELLALAAPEIVALVRRGPHEAELVFITPQSRPHSN